MTDKYQNQYRIPSARLQKWDYRWAGAYFITICTQHREHYFGIIDNGEMQLSEMGILADRFLNEIDNHTKNVQMGEYVVMPNHVHVLLILNGENGDDDRNVETLHATSLQPIPQSKNETMSKISPKSGSVSTVIRSYKSAVSKHAHHLGFTFEWQKRFHDHIIRNNDEYQRILEYIKQNPQNWKTDKFFNL